MKCMMRVYGWRIARRTAVVVLGGVFLLGACGRETRETPSAKLNLVRPSRGALANATYPLTGIEPAVAVKLHDFHFENQSENLRVTLLEEPLAYGDVDGNGTIDAAVTLVYETGGSGSFVELAVMEIRADSLACLGSVFLGDRVKPQSLRIEPKTVAVGLITHGPDDPQCCPTQQTEWTYRWQNGRLTRIEEQ